MASVPLLAATFGMLYVFYRASHPWVSEGISVGFEPARKKHTDMVEDIYGLENSENVTNSNSSQPTYSYGK